ncbi:hypothetical protein [Colwellia sp. 12G3]|uniref:hypothetical protein n=1 Tax=Colwellia sp. 12G3 TaxID=2058299 RepID=UPI000C330AD4|nr:hypothetical protein [Colwellia sp. 12G3]PKI12708.1 hypothetical protein CXF71_18405 [Colwellia sp. 12G3]
MAVFANTYFLQTKQPDYDAKSMLWPVHMWQVYTNSPKGRELNIFEKTILQLFNVSDKRNLKNEDIANWLGLETDMVSYIITAQLIPNGWLTEKGQVTESGTKILDDEVNASLTTAYVFQCAITHQWLPRVCFNLEEIYSINNSDRLKFKFKRSSDYVSVPFVIASRSIESMPPNEEDLRSISTDFQEAIYIAKNTRDNDEWQPEQSKVDRLTLAPQGATPAYLTVWGDTQTSFEWTLYDPFGISTKATWMKELFQQGCKSNKALGQFALAALDVGNAKMDYEEACLNFSEKANFTVLVKYPNAKKTPGLTDALFEMFEAHERISHEKSPHNSTKTKLIVSCGQVLEVVCTQVLKDYVLENPYELPKPQTKNGTEIIKHLIAEATGMSVDMLNQSTKVQPSKIFSAAKGKNSSLRAQLVAIFISMGNHRQHPLKFLLDDQTYFKRFYALTFLRDDCAHKSPPNVSITTVNNAVGLIDTFLNKLFIGIEKNG